MLRGGGEERFGEGDVLLLELVQIFVQMHRRKEEGSKTLEYYANPDVRCSQISCKSHWKTLKPSINRNSKNMYFGRIYIVISST